MVQDLDEEHIEDVRLNVERHHLCRMVFEDNDGGVDDKKSILYDKRWDVYIIQKTALIKDGYYVEVSDYDGKKVIWEVVYDHVVENGKKNDDIGLWGFGFNIFEEDEEGVVREL